MNCRDRKTEGETHSERESHAPYDPPRVEDVVGSDELAREVLYAGEPRGSDLP